MMAELIDGLLDEWTTAVVCSIPGSAIVGTVLWSIKNLRSKDFLQSTLVLEGLTSMNHSVNHSRSFSTFSVIDWMMSDKGIQEGFGENIHQANPSIVIRIRKVAFLKYWTSKLLLP